VIGGDRFTQTFGSMPAGDHDRISKTVVAAVRAGFAVVIDKPGTKIPICTLNASQAKRADNEVQERAQLAGDRLWQRRRHDCGLTGHVLTDPERAGAIAVRMVKTYGEINIGIEPFASRMLVVDVDTPEQRRAFEIAYSVATQQPWPGITVESPGSRDADGNWQHYGGGHWWFTLPDDVQLPAGRGILTDPTGWAAVWARHQVLVPPSSRPEGPYRIVAQPTEAPRWLIERVLAEGTQQAERLKVSAALVLDSGDPLEIWSAQTDWGVLLEPDGWTDAGLIDTCSCPIWTAPGVHASPKSATAHDVGCSKYRVDTGWGPLHIWTDNPPAQLAGVQTLTKVQYLSRTQYAGDDGQVMRAMNLIKPPPAAFSVPSQWTEPTPLPGQLEQIAALHDVPADWLAAAPADEGDLWASPGDPTSTGSPAEPRGRVLDAMHDLNDLADVPSAVPLIDGLLDRSTVAILAGKFGTYKTFVALGWAACIATGRPWLGHHVPEAVPVLYVAAEGATGIRKRMLAWTRTHGPIGRGMFTVITVAARLNDADEVLQIDQALKETGARLLVLDTLHKVTPGMEENSNKEIGEALGLVNRLRERNDVTVLVLHHTGHAGERARGGSSIEDDADSSFVIRIGGEDRGIETPRVLHHRKAKDAELLQPITLTFSPVEGTGSGVVDGDPWINPGGDSRLEDQAHAAAIQLDQAGAPRGIGRDQTIEECMKHKIKCSQHAARLVVKLRPLTIHPTNLVGP